MRSTKLKQTFDISIKKTKACLNRQALIFDITPNYFIAT